MNSKFSMMKNVVIATALVAGFSGIARAEQQYQQATRSGESERHFIASESSEAPAHYLQNQSQSSVVASSDDAPPVKTAER